jgi:general secretion pathway protein G
MLAARGSRLELRNTSHFPTPLPSPRGSRLAARSGFTLIEILIVISIIGILITLAQPSFQRAVTAAREATLKENLFVLRDVIDQFYADNGKYPASLSDLTEKGYIRRIPKDPTTGSAETWVLVPATSEQTGQQTTSPQGQQSGIFDVKSGSEAVSSDGSRYSDW